jgi:hypothetical protein
MLVMPFEQFKAQGRICKSTKAWREEAFEKEWLVKYDEGSGKVVIFVSHTWWDRDFTDETNDPDDPYDKGHPDYQADYPDVETSRGTYQRPKNLKWRIVCAGVQRLCEEQGLNEADVALWVDLQSIYQDDKEMKLKGVISLIAYAARCQFMLIPTEESGDPGHLPDLIPGYGKRGWCRVEYFIFALLAEMEGKVAEYEEGMPQWPEYHVKGTGVQLYAIQRGGELKQYPQVNFTGVDKDLPSDGILSNPNDKPLVTEIQDKMIDTFGHAIVENICGKAKEGERVGLNNKLLRPQHVGSLMAAVEKHQVAKLDLDRNQLGPEGGAKLAEALKTNTTLRWLQVRLNDLDDSAKQAVRAAWGRRDEDSLDL